MISSIHYTVTVPVRNFGNCQIKIHHELCLKYTHVVISCCHYETNINHILSWYLVQNNLLNLLIRPQIDGWMTWNINTITMYTLFVRPQQQQQRKTKILKCRVAGNSRCGKTIYNLVYASCKLCAAHLFYIFCNFFFYFSFIHSMDRE